jgi:hypothetical protein
MNGAARLGGETMEGWMCNSDRYVGLQPMTHDDEQRRLARRRLAIKGRYGSARAAGLRAALN